MPDCSLFDLTGRKALVTGGAAGIGRECALALAKAGADVAIVDLQDGAATEIVAAIERLGRAAYYVRSDVARPDQVEATIEAVAARFGRLDIAINSAGIYRPGDDESQSKDDWDTVIGVNLTGTWMCAKAEMQRMKQQSPAGGKIINIASIAASIACSNAAYDASKAAVVHMTRTLAARWGRYNVNVNCVSPGYVAAAMNGVNRPADERQRIRELTPLGYVQRPADVCGPVLFLASPASDYVTGQNLVVDGGHTLSVWLRPLERSAPARVPPHSEISDP